MHKLPFMAVKLTLPLPVSERDRFVEFILEIPDKVTLDPVKAVTPPIVFDRSIVIPVLCIVLPEVPLNVAIEVSTEELGPITSPVPAPPVVIFTSGPLGPGLKNKPVNPVFMYKSPKPAAGALGAVMA